MTKRLFIHVGYLFLSLLVVFVWTRSPTLSYYNLQLVALLVVAFFAKNLLFKKRSTKTFDAVILAMVILFLVFSTGGAASPLFFLIFFLLFGLSFLFEPVVSVIFSLSLIIFLLPSIKTSSEVASVLALALITPLALFFGKQYLENLSKEKRIKIYQKKWGVDEEIIEAEETDILLWLSTVFKPGMNEIIDRTSQLLSSLGQLGLSQKIHLKRIRRLSRRLMIGGRKLQKSVDKETD